ncbi:MAG: hypothetical protein AAF539_14245, partial [Planctomycetota bacterium]
LGRTLLQREMPAEAKPLLQTVVAHAPTRQNVEALQRSASLTGDVAIVHQCQSRLVTQLPSELPISILTPTQFAGTHQSLGPVPMTAPTGASTSLAQSAATSSRIPSMGSNHASASSTSSGPLPPDPAVIERPISKPSRPVATQPPPSTLVNPIVGRSVHRRGWFW